MNELSKHVAFWPEEKALAFFIAVSEVLELKQRRPRESVEENGLNVIGVSWHDTLDPVVMASIRAPCLASTDIMMRRREALSSLRSRMRRGSVVYLGGHRRCWDS